MWPWEGIPLLLSSVGTRNQPPLLPLVSSFNYYASWASNKNEIAHGFLSKEMIGSLVLIRTFFCTMLSPKLYKYCKLNSSGNMLLVGWGLYDKAKNDSIHCSVSFIFTMVWTITIGFNRNNKIYIIANYVAFACILRLE